MADHDEVPDTDTDIDLDSDFDIETPDEAPGPKIGRASCRERV